MPFQRCAVGFTLVELMVVIAIAGILTALALPSFSTAIRNSRLAGATNEFIGAVNLARSEAVRTNRGGTVCASSNGSSCGSSWADGWIVFADLNRNGVVDADETVVRYQQSLRGLAIAGASSTSFRFSPRGECIDCTAGVFGTGDDLVLQASPCASGQTHIRALRVLRSGAVSFEKRACP